MHSYALGVTSGEERGARGGADGGGDEEIGKLAAFVRHAVEVWRLYLGGTEASEVAVALVVGEDDDKIGLCFGGAREQSDKDEREECGSGHWEACGKSRPDAIVPVSGNGVLGDGADGGVV